MNPLVDELVQGKRDLLGVNADGSWMEETRAPTVLFPGSFNPLHDGHRTLAAVASRMLGRPVAFELSITNVDKPSLNVEDFTSRLSSFRGYAPVWLTRAATFERKAELFPGCTFVVGYDTAIRLIDTKYYQNSLQQRDVCLGRLVVSGCRFLVGGRFFGESFRVWDETLVPDGLSGLFEGIPETAFRVDCSSSELRAGRQRPQ